MKDELEIFAEKVACGLSPVDPSAVFADTLSEMSGKSPIIYDDEIKGSYLDKLSDEIKARAPEFSEVPLDGFYNYAVFSNRPVKMSGGETGLSFVGVPGQFESMAEDAKIRPEKQAECVRTLAKVARSGESVSNGNIAFERVKPVGPTPKSGSLKKMFMTAALMASMTINALVGPYAGNVQAQDIIPAAGQEQAVAALEEPIVSDISLDEIIRDIKGPDQKQPKASPGPGMESYKPMNAVYFGVGGESLEKMAPKMDVLKKSVNDPFFSDDNAEWSGLKRKCEGKSLGEQLEIVNSFWNSKIKYVPDDRLRGQDDYWATPSESLSAKFRGKTMGAGDCEDYAIAKYATAWNLGIGNDANMRIMLVRDQAQKDIGHAVLAFQNGDRTVFLDNQFEKLQTQDTLKGRYRPVYAMNANALCKAVLGKNAKTGEANIADQYKTAAAAQKIQAMKKKLNIPERKEFKSGLRAPRM